MEPLILENMRKAHEIFDANMKKVISVGLDQHGNKATPQCSRFCSACCWEPVYTERREAQLAILATNSLSANEQQLLKIRLEEWVKKFLASGFQNQIAPYVIEYRKAGLPCPFLRWDGKNPFSGECSIYEARPLACRSHLAMFPRENCESDEKRLSKQRFMYEPWIMHEPMNAVIGGSAGNIVCDHFGLLLYEVLFGKKIKSEARMVAAIIDNTKPSGS